MVNEQPNTPVDTEEYSEEAEGFLIDDDFDHFTFQVDDKASVDNADSDDVDTMDIMYNFQTNKHKRADKHALKSDTIFYGKPNKEYKDEFEMEESLSNVVYRVESGSSFEFESRKNEEYVNQRQLSIDVLNVLSEHTSIDFTSNRRKPNKALFNEYYMLLLNKLSFNYNNSELFVELSYYFTDNIFNMFKLLDKQHATTIIKELKEKGYLKDLDDINFV